VAEVEGAGHPENANGLQKWQKKFLTYQARLRSLRADLEMPQYSDIERRGLIKNYEVSLEQTWVILKEFLEYLGHAGGNSIRATLRQAFACGLIGDSDAWFEAIDGRNIYVHQYLDDIAESAVEDIKETFAPLLFALEEKLNEQYGTEAQYGQ
jgi:nucleotidyltransferase substrate binding protein (TIGR01987 family)